MGYYKEWDRVLGTLNFFRDLWVGWARGKVTNMTKKTKNVYIFKENGKFAYGEEAGAK